MPIIIVLFFVTHFYFPASSGQAVVTGRCRPFSPPFFAFSLYRA